MSLTREQMAMAENQAELISEEIKLVSYEIEEIETRVNEWSDRQRYFGKTIDEWSTYFNIPMSPNATPIEVKYYATQLNERMAEAYRYKAKVARAFGEYKAKYELEKSNIIEGHANNRARKTIPAAETLVKVAESELGVRTSVCLKYENALNFWQDVIFRLHSSLKLINIIAMSNGTLAKIEGAY